MTKIVSFIFEGTAKQFVDAGVRLNGTELDMIAVGNLAKHSLIETVGESDKPARGRTPKKYKVESRDGMQFAQG